MSSTKSMTGHTLGAAGGIEAGITALAITRGVLPPTTNYDDAGPASAISTTCRTTRASCASMHAMSNSFGFGGTNAALMMSRYKGTTLKWYAGADHAGWKLKDALVAQLRAEGDEVIDLGTNSDESVDYPTFGAAASGSASSRSPARSGWWCAARGSASRSRRTRSTACAAHSSTTATPRSSRASTTTRT